MGQPPRRVLCLDTAEHFSVAKRGYSFILGLQICYIGAVKRGNSAILGLQNVGTVLFWAVKRG